MLLLNMFQASVDRHVASGIHRVRRGDSNYMCVDYNDNSVICYKNGEPIHIDHNTTYNLHNVLTKKESEYYINDKPLDDSYNIVSDGPKTIITHPDGLIEHYYNELLHNDDGPAVIYPYGTRLFFGHYDDIIPIMPRRSREYKNDKHDKHDKQLVAYYKHGKIHNENGPAIITDCSISYWIDDMLHRIGGPAVIAKYHTIRYYEFNKLHRIDGPAVVDARNEKEFIYCVDGRRHRGDGPAYLWHNQVKYYINGDEMIASEYLQQIEANRFRT
jgi:hypothetical protein